MKQSLSIICILLVAATALLSGCQLSHPGWSSLAYIEVEGAPLTRVHEAAVKVFISEGYEVESAQEREISFVKDGSLNDRVQYARYNESLQMRVEVTMEPMGKRTILVRADAYAVSGGSSRSAVPLLKIARRPYQQILKRVKEHAQATP